MIRHIGTRDIRKLDECTMKYDSRKALAEVVTKKECPACLFAIVDGKADNARDWLLSRSVEKILGYIGVI